MTELSYSFRSTAFGPERTYRIGPNALHWSDGVTEGCVAYSDVYEVRLSRRFAPRAAALGRKLMWRCRLHCRSRDRIVLSPLHCVRLGCWEDRSISYLAFINALLLQMRSSNPTLKAVAEQHWTVRLRKRLEDKAKRLLAPLLVHVCSFASDWNPDRTAIVVGRVMRVVGPWLRQHRVARANIRAAFPEKSARELDRILRGAWDNLGQAMAEYVFLDRLCDYASDNPLPKRIVMDEATAGRIADLRNNPRPALYFAAHLANWELPAVVATAAGLDFAVVYRPPDADALTKYVEGVRARSMGPLIPTGFGAAARIAGALQRGGSVAMLVDQHFIDGVDVVFFGRKCKVNPTLARLARRFECEIYGARIIRLPGRRFRYESTEALRPPRDEEGKLDVAATMQLITSIIEDWVREHPEQWLWMHRRWR
jgi:Kdo2-lipid IVA lauroyltransferase/acyltransferase